VKRFKVSAFESQWGDFINAHGTDREVIISVNPSNVYAPGWGRKFLHCISNYPAKLEDLNISNIWEAELDGLSDHTTSTLIGALAVAAGATIVEKHIRLADTDPSNPDYGHSLIADDHAACNMHDGESECGLGLCHVGNPGYFGLYVDFIREAEKAL